MTLRFIYHYPETNGPDGHMLDVGPLGEVAAAAEKAGFDAFALTEHPAPGARWLANGGHQSLDPFVALGYVAAATTRLRLLTHLVVAPYRNPFLLAKAAATVDILSGGRMVLGLGAGYLKGEFNALGVDLDERNALFDEALDVLPLHWSGEPFSYEGRHFRAKEIQARPAPVQQPIPVWIGGNAPAARRRAAEKAQGWMPMLGPPQLSATARTVSITSLEELTPYVADVRAAAAAAGRPAPDVLYTLSAPDPGQDVDAHRETLVRAEKAGVTWIVASGGPREPAATLDWISGFAETFLG